MTYIRKRIYTLLAAIPMALIAQQTPMIGVNLAGAEFGGSGTTYYQDYIYPNESELNYFHSKGLKLIRLPFKWHRIQPDLYGDLLVAELDRIDTFLDQAEARGMKVILDLHNYAGRNVPGFDSDPNKPGVQGYKIGTPELPVAAYKDLWEKMAAHFKTRTNIWAYGLMNEPTGISTTDWFTAVQAAVDGVRTEDMNNYVLLPGTYYSNAHRWPNHGEYLINVVDPADKRIFEAHSYWDGDHSGRYVQSYAASGVTPTYGVNDLTDFVDWCNANNVQGFIGEFAIDWRDPNWAPVLENALAYMEANGISGTYWAGGPWWNENYPLDLEVDPRTNEPRYPLEILAGYGDGTSQPYAPNFRLYGEGITSGMLYAYAYQYGGAGATVNVDEASTDEAKSGSKSFKVTYTLPSGSYANCGMHIEDGVYLTDNINTDGHLLVMYVRGDTGSDFKLRFKDVTGAFGPQVTLTDFGPAVANSWQRYEIPLTDLVNATMDGSEFIERIRLDLLNKDNTARTFYIDNMEVVGPEYVPEIPEPPATGTLLSETFDDGNADGWVTNGGNWIVEYGEIVSSNQGTNIAWWDDPSALNWSNYTLSADVASTDNDGIGLAFYVQDEDNYYYVSMSKQDTKTRLYKVVNGIPTLLGTNHNTGYTTGQTYSLVVSIDNGDITISRDGQTLLTLTDSTFTQGSVGLSSTWCATAHHDNILVTGNSSLPSLSETFDDGNADGWVTNGGNWIVEYGEIVSSNPGTNIAWWDDPSALNWSNYTLSADVASTDNDGIGLAFYVQDGDNYYYVSMSKQDTKTRLYKVVNGIPTLLGTNHNTGYTTGQTYSLVVSIDNGDITISRDGQTLLTLTDSTFTQGSVGLSSTWCATAHHDNILVTWNDEEVWTSSDVGNTSPSGSTTLSESGEVFTIQASGADIWGTADAFHFAQRELTGDFTITARVTGLVNTDSWAKAGVMIRETLNANAKHASMLVTPISGVTFLRRTSEGGSSASTSTAGLAAPYWVRLQREGNVIKAYRSPNGTTWTQQGSNLTLAMSSTVYAGLAVTSHNNGTLTTATIDNVTIVQAADEEVWTSSDVGNTSPSGSTTLSESGEVFTIQASGADIWGTADAFHFAQRELTGDFTITARVTGLVNTDSWAKAGVMIRETLNANAKHASMLVTPSKGVAFQRRTSEGGSSASTATAGLAAPYWVRLQREGNVIKAYRSPNGTTWTQQGSNLTLSMSSTVYAGLAVTSHNNGTLTTATIDNVTITQP